MPKVFECVICKDICNNKKISDEIKEKLNQLILSGCTIEQLTPHLKDISIKVPTKHYLDKHQRGCLKLDITKLREDNKFSKKINQEINHEEKITNFHDNIDMFTKLQEYRKLDINDRQYNHLIVLDEIKYMCTCIIHEQLLNGRADKKAIIPKEDINALKQVEDILKLQEVIESISTEEETVEKLKEEEHIKEFLIWKKKYKSVD